jgi:nitrate reductase gamma subunit
VAYLMHVLVMIVPFVVLAVVGIGLLWRYRSIPAALVALGFSSVALSHIVSAVVGYFSFTPGDFVVEANRFGWILQVTHWGIVLGIWIGSLSLLWHTFTAPRST